MLFLPSTSQSSKARFCVNGCSSRSAQDLAICSEGDLPNYKPLLDYILSYKEALPRPNAGQHISIPITSRLPCYIVYT